MLLASALPRRSFLALAGSALATPAIHAQGLATLRFGGTGAALGGIYLLNPMLAEVGVALHKVRNLGTPGGIRAVRAGAVDVSISARPTVADEEQAGLRSTLYARSAQVFATHMATPAESLSVHEAVEKVAGRMTQWPGGSRVRMSRRPDQDSDTALLSSLSPAMAAAVVLMQRRPGLVTAATDHEQAEALEVAPGTLGTLALSMIMSERRPLKVLPLRDPAADNWPLLKRFYLVTRVDSSPAVLRFVAMLRSEPAARILASHGHIIPAARAA